MKLLRMLVCVALLAGAVGLVRADEEKIALDKLPKPVLESVKKRFPKAELTSAEKETEGKKVVFEVLLKDGTTTYEMELSEDGTILVIDKLIEMKDLPKVVAETFNTMYPKAKVKKVEEASTVVEGKEAIAFYEVEFSVDGKEMEVQILPSGKVKAEEKKPEAKEEKKQAK